MNWKRKSIKYVCLNVNIPLVKMKELEKIINDSNDLNMTKTVLINNLIDQFLREKSK